MAPTADRLGYAPKPAQWLISVTLGLLWGLALVHGVLYTVLTPPWQAPDEIAHFECAVPLGRLGRPLPPRPSRPNASPKRRSTAARKRCHCFSLTYVLYAAAALPFASAGLIAQLYAIRAAAIAIRMLTVGLTYRLAQLVEPK